MGLSLAGALRGCWALRGALCTTSAVFPASLPLQEWDVGSAAAAATASTSAQQQLDDLRAQLDERNARLDEQARQLDDQRRRLDEQRRELDEWRAREEAGQAVLADLRKQLVRGRGLGKGSGDALRRTCDE